jgi:hypothetical protein
MRKGQPPAKGILHTEQRTPAIARPGLGGPLTDPRGYWLGQHSATPERRARRVLIARLGRRQFLKQIKERRRAAQ